MNIEYSRNRHWLLFFAGVLLFVLGPAIYAYQFSQQNLQFPWYLPTMATIGVLLMLISIFQRRGLFRSLAFVLFLALCGFEWFFFGVVTKTPAYTGPATPGNLVGPFTAKLANGSSFTNSDLQNGIPSVLTFFRGRW